ncbi:DNA alkylation repair protein [Exiguobacterium antarcticum]|uniref:DNA alkylation repair protein n=1 Tax=Exiguobacterium antarcticum TaxID=132920 RepID=A0ABT6R5Z7_9BACL|nr:DNA alkylation repair protein [Exiguobacterium antarcticum]AFS69437.1 DNA alkylation repair domain protein [Exiguobacterium antarcticum B7]MDI3236379.1 DNA alkylation repair protein [Exiguobacterium antarcticum]
MSLIKDVFTPDWLNRLGKAVQAPDFRNVVQQGDWEELAFKQRVRRIGTTLARYVPADFDQAATRLETIAPDFPGLPGIVFPDYIEVHATMDDWDRALLALERLTRHSTSEFAVRRFLLDDQERFLEVARRWSQADDEHIRRLASEGTRPRLPWGQMIPSLIADPRPALPILDRLLQDEALYVRKSVANHLNDIAKTHPELVIKRLERLGTHPHTDWILRHASRTLLKQGHPDVLKAFGLVTRGTVTVDELTVTSTLSIGGELTFTFTLATTEPQVLRIEYAIDYVKKRGTSQKVFRISERQVRDKETFTKRQSFRNLTTRVHYPGTHQLTILINGEAYATAAFNVTEGETE